jgi:hypothetical protein
MTALSDRVASVAGWCVVAALFTLTLPAGVVGGFYLVALAVGA